MATVPRLNYANIRGKSKSKDSENSQRKLQSGSSDLFSHMNQDNLKYIQSQIKQKNKKNTQLALIRKSEDEDFVSSPSTYPLQIQQKSTNLQQTERENQKQSNFTLIQQKQINAIKTDTESIKFNLMIAEQFAPKNKLSQETQTNKLSYYDLMSQAKSKRVPSLEGCLEEAGTNKGRDEKFISFLQNYIEDLNSKNMKKRKIRSRNEAKRNEEMVSQSESEKQILKINIYEQKKKNEMLSRSVQKHRVHEEDNKKRLENLEQMVEKLSQEVVSLRQQLQSDKINRRPIQRTPIYQNHPSQPTHTRYPVHESYTLEGIHDYSYNPNLNYNFNRVSHKNKTASLSSNQQRYLSGKPQASEEKLQQINALERQYELFSETGILQLRQKQNYNFDHFRGRNDLD